MRKSAIAMLAGTAFAAGAIVSVTNIAGAAHQGPLLTANLDGRSEVASGAKNNKIVGDPNGYGESYFFVSNGGETLCYVMEVGKIEPATAAHIHEAPTGTNGPVVATLGAPTAGYSAACTSDISAAQISEIVAEPANYYVNVHNKQYPNGALRGQLSGR